MSRYRHCLAVIALAACASQPPNEAQLPALPFSEVAIDTAPGLSGLAVDASGIVWTVAERDRHAYRIELHGGSPVIAAYEITGVPDGVDVEGMTILSPTTFAFAGEGRAFAGASVLMAELRDRQIVVVDQIDLPAPVLGVELTPNSGAEGICSSGDVLLVAIESWTRAGDRRWSPIVAVRRGRIVATYKLWLRTKTGKVSALACRRAPGGIEAMAIERHFEETEILRFTLRPDDKEITPTEVLDLGPVLHGRLNLEGIGWMPDGSVVAVNDNDYHGVAGPSEILVFPSRSPRRVHR